MRHVPPPAGDPLQSAPSDEAVSHIEGIKSLARLREEAASEVERLLSFLDQTDGDADLEDDEREDDSDEESAPVDDEDGRDDEPSLGWTASGCHGDDDREDEHDGREPSLCGVSVDTTYNDRDLEGDGGCDYEERSPVSTMDQRRWSI